MINYGKVQPCSTIEIWFDSFASTGGSITMTGLAVGDIKVYKNGGTTARSSTTGFTLLDTDGIDFASITGIHSFSIDLSSDADAGFWVSGARYIVVVSTITVDSQTISFVAAQFTIGEAGSILDTTIATLASQISFTLTVGPADNDALNGCVAVVHDKLTAVQQCLGIVLDYVGASKTVALLEDPAVFTMAVGDNISFMPVRSIESTYHADIAFIRDQSGVQDEYVAIWFKNGVRITSGITSPTIQVIKRVDGTDLIASTAMTQIGSTGAYKYTAVTTERQTTGEGSLVVVGATIDAASRTFAKSLGRDS